MAHKSAFKQMYSIWYMYAYIPPLQCKWIGGYMNAEGVKVRGKEALKKILSSHFTQLEDEYMQFLIRENVYEHQWGVSHASVWMRKID